MITQTLYLVDIFIHLEQDLPVTSNLNSVMKYAVFLRKPYTLKQTLEVLEQLQNVKTQIYKTPKQNR